MTDGSNGTKGPQSKFDELMARFAQVCVQLGELEYHYLEVLPRRRKELVKEMNELQKQANRCKAIQIKPQEAETKPTETSEQS